jgi:3-hydroxy-9,10-secoandrosta-1,3,5(10)-triene-9,17-dione monooxygenase reductase component
VDVIHHDNPFADDPDSRDPIRRFRGRLSAPVTIVTSGAGEDRTGLTVSSLLVVEGEPGLIQAVVGPTSDLWGVVAETGRFVVHICSDEHRGLAEVFAGIRPSPGGIFATATIADSDWGPVLEEIGDRAFCTLESFEELGYGGLVTGRIDRVDVAELSRPLVYFRGRFRSLQ